LPARHQLLPGGKAILAGHAVPLSEALTAGLVRLGHGDEPQLVRVQQRVGRVGIGPPVPRTNGDGFEWFTHDDLPVPQIIHRRDAEGAETFLLFF